MDASAGCRKSCCRSHRSSCISICRTKSGFANGSARTVSVAGLHRSEPPDVVHVCRSWNFLLSAAAEPHPGSGILGNRCRRSDVAHDPTYVLIVAVVRRVGRESWRAAALIIGPVISTLGFLLFSIPSVGGSYWVTFFPAVVVLGLGMTVSVAPLTTVVMEAVDQDRVGTASGINNAVARVAALLAVAIFGVVMVASFSDQLNRRLTAVQMPADARAELQSNESRLAALTVPAGVDPATAHAIESSILASFVFSFRLVMWLCAALALISAAIAWKTIPKPSARSADSKMRLVEARTGPPA